MPWTSLPALLGVPGTELTFDLVERACAEALSERSDIDWKGQLPLTATENLVQAAEQQEELAKDIAAMANSGGGVIVYGVVETRANGRSNAQRISPVGEVTEAQQKQIMQCAANLIYPPVMGLTLRPLYPPDDLDGGVLAIIVNDSPDAPHLVHPKKQTNKNWFGVPWRNGPETEWMVERQIAAAYRQREQFRRTHAHELDELYDSTLTNCLEDGHTTGAWIFAVARPDQLAYRPRDLTLSQAEMIVRRSLGNRRVVGDPALGPLDLLSAGISSTRGIQMFRHVQSQEYEGIGTSLSSRAFHRPTGVVHIHGNGSAAVGLSRDDWQFPHDRVSKDEIARCDLEQTAIDLWCVMEQLRAFLGLAGDYVVQIGVAPSSPVFRFDAPNRFIPTTRFAGSVRPGTYVPVKGPVLASLGRDQALASMLDLITDAVHQAGGECRLKASSLS